MKAVYRAVALILALTGFAWVSPCTAANTTTIYEFKGATMERGHTPAWSNTKANSMARHGRGAPPTLERFSS